MEEKYYNQIINSFEGIFNDNFIIWKNKGTILELINCIKNNCIMYFDVPFEYKEKYNLSFIDDGIDCVNTENNKIYQVKFYSKGKLISNHTLGTFFVYLHNLQKFNFKFYLIHSQNVLFSKNKIDDLLYEEINNITINQFIHNAYNLFFNKLDNTLLNDLHNEINIVFNHLINNEYYDINKLKEIKNNLIDKLPKKKEIIEIKQLYKHQEELLNIMNNTTQKDNYFNLPCASGKTYVIELFSMKCNKKVLILVPNILLAEQYKDDFNNNFKININECWTYTDKKFNNKLNIYVCVYDSYEYLKYIDFDYIIVDEAHHILKYINDDIKENDNVEDDEDDEIQIINNKEIYNDINNKENIKFYYSATLLFINKELTYYYSMDKAIEDNIINDFNIIIHQVKELNDLSIIKTLQIHQEYKRILIYCSRIDTIKQLTLLFNKYNIPSDYLSSDIDKRKRKEILKKLYNGKLRVVFSVNTICEGIDIPNVDTCYFYNDKNSIISIIQCLGRIMRKSIDKDKSNLLFFTNDINDCNYVNYLNKINKYCNKFMNIRFNNENIFKHIKYYNENFNIIEENIDYDNYNEEDNIDIIDEEEIKTIIMENVIKNLNVNDEMKLKLCEEFYKDNKRLPKKEEQFKYFYIGKFIHNLKFGRNKHLKNKVEEIFNDKIETKIKINKKLDEDIIKLCEEFYKLNNRLPKQNEKYKEWNIGNFISNLKKGQNKHLKVKVEKIFNKKIETKIKINKKLDEEKIKLCEEYAKENNNILPKRNEIYKGWNIGDFINGMRHGKNKHLKEKIEKIFNCKIEKIREQKKFTDDEKIKLCEDFYKLNERLPKDKEEINEFNIGNFIYGLKIGRNKQLKEQIENIFHCKIENIRNIKKK